MRVPLACLLGTIACATFAAETRDELHDGVRFSIKADVEISPSEILKVAKGFVDALNRQDTAEALNYVHEKQKERFAPYLEKNKQRNRLLIFEVWIWMGRYNMGGDRLPDRILAKVRTRDVDGQGGMSFTLLYDRERWFVVDS